VVFFQDECHLLWGDLCGYIWAAAFGGKLPPETCLGKTSERIEVPILNERERQTYYGAVNLHTQECLIQTYDKGNSQSTIAFVDYLLKQHPNHRIALLWDGASYHRSEAFRDYLSSINQGLDESEWKVTRQSASSKSGITYANLFVPLSLYLSLQPIDKYLISLSFLLMVVSHK
jgi:transposase